MAPFSALFLAASAVGASAFAVARSEGGSANSPISVPLYQDVRIRPVRRLRKRDDDTSAEILNMTSTSYLIELDLGSPAQTVKVALDTGSSELWLNPNCATAGNGAQERICNDHGHYSPSRSDTSQISQTQNTITYGKGEVQLQYVADTIQVPGTDINLNNVIFGYGLDSVDLTTGILGLSFGEGINTPYATVVDELADQNVTKTRAFSIALGKKDEPTGTGVISFGGIDTKKFSGDLHTMPVMGQLYGENISRYWVQLESIGIDMVNGPNETYRNSSFPVFFDTGATLSYLPEGIIQDMARDLNGQFDDQIALYTVPCDGQGTFDFTFDGYTIKVDYEEFIWDAGVDVCVLGADATNDNSYILGDSFLRSVYTVYDLETPALHFAPYANCGSNPQMIPGGKNATRQFSGECAEGATGGGNSGSTGSNGGGSGGGGTPNDNGNGAGQLSPSSWVRAVGLVVGAQALLSI